MKYLLDTNVVSEWVKPTCAPAVYQWVHRANEDSVFISVVTFSEIRSGIDRMPAGARRERLDEWLTFDLARRFRGRILPIDTEIAIECGRVVARQHKTGRAADAMDAFIAATALHHELTLVTRNTSDFDYLGINLINPWLN